jgi:Fur family ferric uptake transcriptional regulator
MARSDGYNTKTRQLILDYLINNRQHAVSASNILAHLEEQGAAPNPTTVYRYLDKLAGEQRVMKYVADKGEKAVFQYVDGPPLPGAPAPEVRAVRPHLPPGLPFHG